MFRKTILVALALLALAVTGCRTLSNDASPPSAPTEQTEPAEPQSAAEPQKLETEEPAKEELDKPAAGAEVGPDKAAPEGEGPAPE